MKKHLISLWLEPKQLDMLDKVCKSTGLPRRTDALRFALINAYKKEFPNYSVPKHGALDPKEKARLEHEYKSEVKDLASKEKEDKLVNICENVLFGEVIDVDGVKHCQWKTYDLNSEYTQKVPLETVNESYKVFIPSKEMVLKRRPALKKKFKE